NPPPDHDHRALRTARIKWSILTSLLSKPLAVIMPIVTLPLFMNYLKIERYGLYESIGALTVWLGLTNVGLTLGLINRLTDCHVSGDRELARRYVSSLTFLLLGITLLTSTSVSILVPLVNCSNFFNAQSPLAR